MKSVICLFKFNACDWNEANYSQALVRCKMAAQITACDWNEANYLSLG